MQTVSPNFSSLNEAIGVRFLITMVRRHNNVSELLRQEDKKLSQLKYNMAFK